MKKFQKHLLGLGATVLSFGIFGHVSTSPGVQDLGDKVVAQLAEYETINDQFNDLESTLQKIEIEVAEFEEDYLAAKVLADQYASLQTALSEAESFDPENVLSDEIKGLLDAEGELKRLEDTQSEILPLYESARAENEDLNRAQRLGLVQATVTNIVDGDTIDVTINGTSERVRFIGVDSPERGENGFNEATEFTRSEIARVGNTVWLQSSGADRDNTSSRRLRRYIWLGVPNSLTHAGERSELNLNQRLLDNGHAVVWAPGGSSTSSAGTSNTNTNPDSSNEMIVYWTVNGSVWHRRRDCRGLNRANERNIRSGTIAESGKYRECQHSARGR